LEIMQEFGLIDAKNSWGALRGILKEYHKN
jgi:hypothetical protein